MLNDRKSNEPHPSLELENLTRDNMKMVKVIIIHSIIFKVGNNSKVYSIEMCCGVTKILQFYTNHFDDQK